MANPKSLKNLRQPGGPCFAATLFYINVPRYRIDSFERGPFVNIRENIAEGFRGIEESI